MSSNEELLCDSKDIRRRSLLGGGTFGQVYRSEHCHLGLLAERVVKKLPAEQEQRVRETIMPLYRLRCDNATRLYGLVLHPDNYSFLMEYAHFGPVEELIKVKPPWAVRAKVMREVATGLKYLHTHHVVHGNLSRHNVVISSDLVAKVTDFGLREWRVLASDRHGGDMGASAGTPPVGTDQYAPPETFTKPVTEAPTCSFDIYSYGILSWEVITCEQAWKGLSPTELHSAVRKGQRPVQRGGQPFPAVCPLTMRNITTEAWRQQPSDRPAFSDILRRMMTKSDVQWSADQLRTAENEARKKLTDALRVSTRVRTPRQGSVLAGLPPRSREANGMSPRGAVKTRHGERHMSPRVSQAFPRVSQVSQRVSQVSPRVSHVPRRVTERQATRPSGRATPVTKQGERKEKSNGKLNSTGPRVDDQGETKSSRPHNRENASSVGSRKSPGREKEKTTQATDSSQLSDGRCSAQTLTRDEGFSESSFTDDQMSHEGSQCESGAVGSQSSDELTKAADEPAGAADEPAEAPDEAADHDEAADEPAEAADEPAEAADEPAEAADEPGGADDDEFEDEQAEPVTIQYRGLLRPDQVLNVQPEAQQSAGNEIQSDETNRARDEEQISSSFDSNDETLVKVPFNEQIEDPDRDLRAEEGGQERRTQQIDGSGVVGCSSTTQLQPQALFHTGTLQHQSQFISHGITEQHFYEAGPVDEINQQTAEQQTDEQETAETAQQEQNTSAAGEVVTAMTQPPAVPQVITPSYPAVIYYDEADPEIAQVMQVAHLLRHTWGLKVFDPHRDGVGDKMTSFQHSFENSQHAVAVLTPSVIRNMRENRPNTASFRIATFLAGLLETHAQTCRRRLIPVQIGRDEIPFILCNFCVLRLGTSGFHRKLYRAVGNQTLSGDTGLPIRDLRGWADKMPQSEDTVNTVAAMLRLPPEVLIDIKEEFGGSRARLIEVLECWWLHHGASTTDVRLRQMVATVTEGQESCVRGQRQVQAAVPGGQGSCVGGRGQVQAAVPRGQGSCVRDQGQVQAPVPGGQDQTQRQQYEERQAVADMTTLLRTNRVQLIEALGYLDSVLDHLFSRSVITNEEMYQIKSHRVRFDQARELLDILATKGEGACAEFKSVLAEVNPHAATFLET